MYKVLTFTGLDTVLATSGTIGSSAQPTIVLGAQSVTPGMHSNTGSSGSSRDGTATVTNVQVRTTSRTPNSVMVIFFLY